MTNKIEDNAWRKRYFEERKKFRENFYEFTKNKQNIEKLIDENNTLIDKATDLLDKNYDLEKENRKLKRELEEREEEIKRYKNLLETNSTNSSLPPSSDCLWHSKPISGREKSSRHVGGQLNHPSTRSKLIEGRNVEVVIHHNQIPPKKMACSMKTIDGVAYYVYQEVDLKLTTRIIENRFPVGNKTGEIHVNPNISGTISNPVVYTNNTKALICLLTNYATVSINRTRKLIRELTNGSVNIADSSIVNFNIETFNKLGNFTQENLVRILKCDQMHVDETSIKINDQLHWLVIFRSGNDIAYKIFQNRGDSVKEVLMLYKGVLISDHFIAYFKLKCLHAECNAHIIRYLKQLVIIEEYEEGNKLIKLLLEINDEKTKLMKSGINQFTSEQLLKYEHTYISLLESMQSKLNLIPKEHKHYHIESINLVKRMIKYKNEHLHFAQNFNIPFTNNDAERPLRMIKAKKKISGCFRSVNGANAYVTIMSVIQNTLLSNNCAYGKLVQTLSG